MVIPGRVHLVPVDGEILSSYGDGGRTGGPRTHLRALASLGGAGRMTPDAAAALLVLHRAVLDAGGDFRVTDCYRATSEQAAARARYERWIAAGSPSTKSAAFDAQTMKAAFVAKAGRSNHNAGRAVDLDVGALRFPHVAADRQLDTLWEIARPIGWRPIIKAPTEGASESWHFDYLGPWALVQARLGYEQAAIAAVLDLGDVSAFPSDGARRRIQSTLHRAGFDVGDIDGITGVRTEAAIRASGWSGSFSDVDGVIAHLDALPDSSVVWRG